MRFVGTDSVIRETAQIYGSRILIAPPAITRGVRVAVALWACVTSSLDINPSRCCLGFVPSSDIIFLYSLS